MGFDFDEEERLLTSTRTDAEDAENTLRPKTLEEYIGQENLKSNLTIYMQAAKQRGEALDHVLLYGPAGLGKTTLSHIIANEMGAQIRVTSGPAIEKAADLAAILTNLNENDVLFIDEIHRLHKSAEEILYSAMEDYALDFVIGKGPSARSVRLPLPHFTLIGATTKAGMLTSPLRDRFGVSFRLELYSPEELTTIINRSAKILNTDIEPKAALEIASRSRGTPRIANRLLKRVRDFAEIQNNGKVDLKITQQALGYMEIDECGLDKTDRRLLLTMMKSFGGRPVGLDTLAAATGEDANTIEDVYEPYLMQLCFIARTPRGRVCMRAAYEHFDLPIPKDVEESIAGKNQQEQADKQEEA